MSQYEEDVDTWGDTDPTPAPLEERTAYRSIRLKKSEKGTKLNGYNFGDFVVMNKGTAEGSFTEIQLVPIQINLGRALKSKYVPGRISTTFCSSDNRLVPITYGDFSKPKAVECSNCPYGDQAWDRYNEAKDRADLPANPCEKNAEIVFADFNNPSTVYSFRGDRERYQFENLLTKLRDDAKKAITTLDRKPKMFEFVVTMTSGTNQKGQWVPVFRVDGLMEPVDVHTFANLYTNHVQSRQRYRDQKEAEKQQIAEANQMNAVTQGGQQVVQRIAPAGQPQRRPVQNLQTQVNAIQQQVVPQTTAATGVVRRVNPAQTTHRVSSDNHPTAVDENLARAGYAAPTLEDTRIQRPTDQQPTTTPINTQGVRPFTPPVSRRVPGTRPTYVAPQQVQQQQPVQEPIEEYYEDVQDDDIPF